MYPGTIYARKFLNSKVLVNLKEKYNDHLFYMHTQHCNRLNSRFYYFSFIGVLPNDLILNMICCQIMFNDPYELLTYHLSNINYRQLFTT